MSDQPTSQGRERSADRKPRNSHRMSRGLAPQSVKMEVLRILARLACWLWRASPIGQRGMWRCRAEGSADKRLQVGQDCRGRDTDPTADSPTARRREEQKISGWQGWARLLSVPALISRAYPFTGAW